MKTVLICHASSRLNREGIARWLSSFSELTGIVLIEERPSHVWTRVRREIKRIGLLRFLDVLGFRLYYKLLLADADSRWLNATLDRIAVHYGDLPASAKYLRTPDPNSPEVEAFLKQLAPDMVIARCKRILRERIFAVPQHGTFVLHPGVCPEYRNAHGAFWALARRDHANVGLTLLQIDRGVDTGPVYGYYTYDFDEVAESHIVIMTRLALDNLDAMRDKLLEVHAGKADRIDTSRRASGVWGQPWLTAYLRWKFAARRLRANSVARVS